MESANSGGGSVVSVRVRVRGTGPPTLLHILSSRRQSAQHT